MQQLQHPWNVSPSQAREIQSELRHRIIKTDQFGQINTVAGIDLGYDLKAKKSKAAVAVLSFPELQLIEHQHAVVKTEFPYVPGLLSFREVPAALAALNKLQSLPDLILCDGQGYAHPRRFGLACHLGLLCDIPTIGVAKTRLIGKHDPLAENKGAQVPLMDKGEVIGAVVRTRTGVKPLYVSIGHKISLPSAVSLTLQCACRYRLPETTRWADRLAAI